MNRTSFIASPSIPIVVCKPIAIAIKRFGEGNGSLRWLWCAFTLSAVPFTKSR